MHVAIVGPGRLGRSLHALLPPAGHDAVLVGRSGAVPAGTGVVLLTVPDPSVPSVAATVPLGPVLLHCAGSLSHDVLRPHPIVGSLHPLMTFPGPEVALPELAGVPAAVAGDPPAVAIARQLAADLGMVPFHVPGDRRLYHAAAVMAGNLTMVLMAQATRVLEHAGVAPEEARRVLVPLAISSVQNSVHPLSSALTGPIARGDRDALERHRAALADAGLDHLRALYDQLVTIAELHLRAGDAEE